MRTATRRASRSPISLETTIDTRKRSKKRSAASSRSRPQPESPTFFVDRALGTVTVAERLREAGCDVEIHDRHFAQDAKDTEWLAEVGHRGWVVLTKDHHIRTRHGELIALLSAGVAAFVLTAGDLTGTEMSEAFVKALPKIKRMLIGQPRPFIARVSPSGVITLIVRGMPRWLRRELRRAKAPRKTG